MKEYIWIFLHFWGIWITVHRPNVYSELSQNFCVKFCDPTNQSLNGNTVHFKFDTPETVWRFCNFSKIFNHFFGVELMVSSAKKSSGEWRKVYYDSSTTSTIPHKAELHSKSVVPSQPMGRLTAYYLPRKLIIWNYGGRLEFSRQKICLKTFWNFES